MINLENLRKQAVTEYKQTLLKRREAHEAWKLAKRSSVQEVKNEMLKRVK